MAVVPLLHLCIQEISEILRVFQLFLFKRRKLNIPEENDVLPTTSHIISSNFIISCCTISKGVHFLLHVLRHKLEARVILPHEDVNRMNSINCMREILKHNNITTWIVFKIRDAIFSYFIQATRNVRFLALMLQSFINCICT